MRILLYSVNYAPEPISTGKFTGELGQFLAERGHDVQVICAPPYYPDWQVWRSYRAWWYRSEQIAVESQGAGSLRVWRCPLWVPRQPTGLKRLLLLLTFAFSSFPVALSQLRFRPDVVLLVEPSIAVAPTALLVARLTGAVAWLHVQDFELEAALGLGLLKGGRFARFARAIDRWLHRRFDRVSTISNRMRERLVAMGVVESRLALLPNWVDTGLIFPAPDSDGDLRQQLGLSQDKVIALYAGNLGEKQGLELVIEAARLLKHDDRIAFVLCGQGAARDRLQRMAIGLENIHWLPVQPLDRLNMLLNMGDIHLLPQLAGAADLVMPSKLTGIFASGRPVIATVAEQTELASAIAGKGVRVDPGDVAGLVVALCQLRDHPQLRAEQGERARHYALEQMDKARLLGRFTAALASAVSK
ncbi:MAG: glycosyltransferase WbuB [Gammaproteobacteria bacterium]|nr:glycosyltransferase WbuB [Gammaproteobacteria bacterium]